MAFAGEMERAGSTAGCRPASSRMRKAMFNSVLGLFGFSRRGGAPRRSILGPGENRMLKRILLVVGILAGVAVLVLALGYFEDRRLAKLTASAPGQVTRVVVQTDAESDDASTVVHFTYGVNGQTLSDQSTKGGDVSDDFPQGAPVTVCHDPAKPADTEVYEVGHACPPQ